MATEAGKTTRFIEVDFIVSGAVNFRVDGYDDGTSLSLAPQGDQNTVRLSNDGKATFAENKPGHWIATLSLLESSDSNDELSKWLASGLTAEATFLDKNGRTVITSAKARIRQYPTVTKSAGVEVRAWDIHMLSTEPFVGGLNA
jgi:hypothetical protein